jgi:hypothetical protein
MKKEESVKKQVETEEDSDKDFDKFDKLDDDDDEELEDDDLSDDDW